MSRRECGRLTRSVMLPPAPWCRPIASQSRIPMIDWPAIIGIELSADGLKSRPDLTAVMTWRRPISCAGCHEPAAVSDLQIGRWSWRDILLDGYWFDVTAALAAAEEPSTLCVSARQEARIPCAIPRDIATMSKLFRLPRMDRPRAQKCSGCASRQTRRGSVLPAAGSHLRARARHVACRAR